jgi:hypothetical protein
MQQLVQFSFDALGHCNTMIVWCAIKEKFMDRVEMDMVLNVCYFYFSINVQALMIPSNEIHVDLTGRTIGFVGRNAC